MLLATSGRCIVTLTGRRAARAPKAASSTSARKNSLAPKPPPTKGDIKRISSRPMFSVLARSFALQLIIWLEVHTISLSPSQAATEACGSIMAWEWSGVV